MSERDDVLRELNEFFDTPVKGTGGGWPVVTADTQHRFAELLRRIADLAFIPDFDVDNVFTIHVHNRMNGHAHSLFVPKAPESIVDGYANDGEVFHYLDELARSLQLANSTADQVTREMRAIMQHRSKHNRERETQEQERAAIMEMIQMGREDEAQDRIKALLDRVAPIIESSPAKARRPVPEWVTGLIDAFGERFLTAAMKADFNAKLLLKVAFAAKAVGMSDFNHRKNEVRSFFFDLSYRYGERPFRQSMLVFGKVVKEHEAMIVLANRDKTI